MKIASDTIREVTKYSRVLTVEDGPIVAGTGTIRYIVESVVIRWAKGEKPVETHVWGHKVLKNGDVSKQSYKRIYWLDRDDCPGWLTELIKLPEIADDLEGKKKGYLTQMGIEDGMDPQEAQSNAATIMNDIFANSPDFVEQMEAAVEANQKK